MSLLGFKLVAVLLGAQPHAAPAASHPAPKAAVQAAPARLSDPAMDLKANLIYTKVGFLQGPSHISLFQDGNQLDVGFLGGNVDAIFGGFPEALAAAQNFRMDTIL